MAYNPQEVNKLFQEYYILGLPQLSKILPHRQQAESPNHELIVGAGYEWNPKKMAYVDTHIGQSIVALPNDQFIWMISNYGKVLKNPEKLNIWLGGRGEQFVGKLMFAMGKSNDIKFSGPGERQVPYTPSGDPTDTLIAKLTRQAGKSKTLPSDLMIDLGQTAKKDNNEKMLAFLKTIKPMNENTIKASTLNSLVREIVKGIVKEGYGDDDGEVLKFARMTWGDNNWRVKNSKSSDHGTVYQVTFNEPHSRFLWKANDGSWKALDPKTKAWNPLKSDIDEMSTTGGVSPVMTPNAFKKHGPMEEGQKCRIKGCSGKAVSNVEHGRFNGLCKNHIESQKDQETRSGEHSKMIHWIHTGKHELPENALQSDIVYKDRQGGADVYWINNKDEGRIFIKPEKVNQYLRKGYEIVDLANADQVNEMTTTGDVSGYNIPSAFSKRGGSSKGVAGSETLGYTLTPAGKKEMNRPADKLKEGQ